MSCHIFVNMMSVFPVAAPLYTALLAYMTDICSPSCVAVKIWRFKYKLIGALLYTETECVCRRNSSRIV